jgi:hypothetical protein
VIFGIGKDIGAMTSSSGGYGGNPAEDANGGLGELVRVKADDPAAQELAERIGVRLV